MKADTLAGTVAFDSDTDDLPTWVIESGAAGVRARLREVWQYRRLAAFFGNKALQRLYARTHLGWIWLFIRPLFPLLVKAVVFGGLMGVSSDGVPYFLFLMTASTIWELFASALMWGTRSLELNRGLLKQIYIPRLIMLPAMMTPALFTLFLHLVVLAGALVWYWIWRDHLYLNLSPQILWSVAALGMALLLALALALWTSVPALAARDVRFTLSYILNFWVFLTPVFYPLSSVPERWRPWMALNPMVSIVEAFKWGILGIGQVHPWQLASGGMIILVALTGGLVYFNRAETHAADRV